MRKFWLSAIALASCATLNTMGMAPECRDEYNACLNSCQGIVPNMAPGPPVETASAPREPGAGFNPAQSGCVDECNKTAKSCDVRHRATPAATPTGQ
jgi:hypothetical protein